MSHNFHARNYAAQIGNTTAIVRAYLKENAVKFMQSKDASITKEQVYCYDGITGASPIDEVVCTSQREWNNKGELVWTDVYNVRMREEYAHL